MKTLSDGCNFPWLLSNMVGRQNKIPARGIRTHIMERHGLKIGFMGLAEQDWIATLSDPPEDIQYQDFVETGKELVQVRHRKGVLDS